MYTLFKVSDRPITSILESFWGYEKAIVEMISASLAGDVATVEVAWGGVVELHDALRLDGRVCITGASSSEGIGSVFFVGRSEKLIQDRKADIIIVRSARKSCHTRRFAQ